MSQITIPVSPWFVQNCNTLVAFENHSTDSFEPFVSTSSTMFVWNWSLTSSSGRGHHFFHNFLVPERYFLIEWVTFLFPVVKIEQKCLALFVFEKTQWSASELSIFYKPEGSRGKRQRRTLSSKVGSAKIRGADVKTRPGWGLQPQRLQTRFLDTWPEEFSASSKVAF